MTVRSPENRSLSDVAGSVRLPAPGGSVFRRFLAFAGPGYLVSVGYMDPGNWATDLQGGARAGYTLLSVILLSGLIAVLLQALSARLGIATGLDLAQACRSYFPRSVSLVLWVVCELAIIACDLAEVIGTAVAFQLLFHFSLATGAVLSVLDTFLVLLLMGRGFRYLEAFIIALLGIIAVCFGVQLWLSAPDPKAVLLGFVPRPEILTDGGLLYIATGIIGATVMPHNLYLHSSIVQTRDWARTPEGRREAIRFSTADSTVALTLALFVNSAILIVSAAAFHTSGHTDITDIGEACRLLAPVLGTGLASVLFASALLAAGTSSTITGTLAGQIVMEGFLHLRIPAWARRLVTRCVAVVPVLGATLFFGDRSVDQLLLFSQVVLSMQLPFAVVPLVWFVSRRDLMGEFTISRPVTVLAWIVAAVILLLNFQLLYSALRG